MKEAKKKSPTTKSKEEKPLEELAILPLKNGVVYPNAMMPITIGQERSIKLVDDALVKEKIIGIVPVKNADIEVPNPEDLYTMGCSAHILKMMKLPENQIKNS